MQVVSLYIQNQYIIYKHIEQDFETRFDSSNCQLDRPLQKRKKEVVRLMKGGLGGKKYE